MAKYGDWSRLKGRSLLLSRWLSLRSSARIKTTGHRPLPKTQKDRNARPVNPVMIETIRIPKWAASCWRSMKWDMSAAFWASRDQLFVQMNISMMHHHHHHLHHHHPNYLGRENQFWVSLSISVPTIQNQCSFSLKQELQETAHFL